MDTTICVYLLKSLKDGKRYIGSTNDLQRRLKEHNLGKARSTKYRRPLVLLGYQITESIEEAAKYEKIYKRSSGALNRAIKSGLFKIVSSGV